MKVAVLERERVWEAWLIATALIVVMDALYLTVAVSLGRYAALKAQRGWWIYFAVYTVLFGGLVAAVEGGFVVGAAIGFFVFAVYNITTLATTDYDMLSATSDLVYGTIAYGIVFEVTSRI